MNDKTNDKAQKFTHCCSCGEELELVVVDLVPERCGVVCNSCLGAEVLCGVPNRYYCAASDLTTATDKKEVANCEYCHRTLPIEEFDEWYLCPHCDRTGPVENLGSDDVTGCELCGKLFPYEDLDDYWRCPDCSN